MAWSCLWSGSAWQSLVLCRSPVERVHMAGSMVPFRSPVEKVHIARSVVSCRSPVERVHMEGLWSHVGPS